MYSKLHAVTTNMFIKYSSQPKAKFPKSKNPLIMNYVYNK